MALLDAEAGEPSAVAAGSVVPVGVEDSVENPVGEVVVVARDEVVAELVDGRTPIVVKMEGFAVGNKTVSRY